MRLDRDYRPLRVRSAETGDLMKDGARAGDRVECPNGHRIGRINRFLCAGSLDWGQAVDFDGDAPSQGAAREQCRCPTCDAIWLYPYLDA